MLADRDYMIIMITNLIENAIKYSKEPVIIITTINTPEHFILSIKDNGIGIEDEHKDKIFIIIQRLHTRAEYEGSGIRLAHCKKIIELHRGKIWVESQPGEGSCFYFTILEI